MTHQYMISLIAKTLATVFLTAILLSLSVPVLAQSDIPKKQNQDTTKEVKVYVMDDYEGPEFPGGIKVLYKWIADSLSYPDTTADWSGKIVVEFDITEEGEIANPRIIKGGPPTFENEIIKVINKMPNWNPRTSNGKPIKSSYALPITFKLADEEPSH